MEDRHVPFARGGSGAGGGAAGAGSRVRLPRRACGTARHRHCQGPAGAAGRGRQVMPVKLEVRRVREYGERIYPVGPPAVMDAVGFLLKKEGRWRLSAAEVGALGALGVEIVE